MEAVEEHYFFQIDGQNNFVFSPDFITPVFADGLPKPIGVVRIESGNVVFMKHEDSLLGISLEGETAFLAAKVVDNFRNVLSPKQLDRFFLIAAASKVFTFDTPEGVIYVPKPAQACTLPATYFTRGFKNFFDFDNPRFVICISDHSETMVKPNISSLRFLLRQNLLHELMHITRWVIIGYTRESPDGINELVEEACDWYALECLVGNKLMSVEFKEDQLPHWKHLIKIHGPEETKRIFLSDNDLMDETLLLSLPH